MPPKTEIKTVMFVDVVNYTKTTSKLRREEVERFHDIFDSLSLPKFELYNGTVVKKIGDAFLVTFNSATDAVLCAVDLQRSCEQYSKDNKLKYPFSLRVALHAGEVITKNKDIYGDAVNIASRLEQMTKPHHIILSETVFTAMNKNEIPFLHLGVKKLKGVRYPLRLFRVKSNYDKSIFKGHTSHRVVKRSLRFIWNTLLFIFLVALIGGMLFLVLRFFGFF
ncbi:adenylate/guanylate cyclase domain-containing protein [Candidatus Woesearchaeota archaeon]|nr:adenylate/guanylate cyclase domain-containing protein [Candidatus Woesearchaeota archaeon]